ncbi:MAG: hypothetical protein KDI01_09860 [Halioglobus sp.]|nr:hypothetical protein [Halioglobus sp.]
MLFVAGAGALLQACASAPPEPQPVAAPPPHEVPELTLNLPREPQCRCDREEKADPTFLERGFSALVAGDHIEAVQYFQSYQRLESSPVADWESGMAIAYDSMLRRSPFYDPGAARKSYRALMKAPVDDALVHENILMMRDALGTFVEMDRKNADLEKDNAELREDLKKRKEVLKRLRELTLGQKGARQ